MTKPKPKQAAVESSPEVADLLVKARGPGVKQAWAEVLQTFAGPAMSGIKGRFIEVNPEDSEVQGYVRCEFIRMVKGKPPEQAIENFNTAQFR